MVTQELIQLIKTLSGSEKRNFKLYCKKQSGDKDYLVLFNIINKASLDQGAEAIKSQFRLKYPGKSFENTAQYLLRVVTDSLVQIRASHDPWFQQYHSLMRSKVLSERSLWQEGHKELKKAQKLSAGLQDNIMHYQTCRLELNYWSASGFSDISEQELVNAQMKSKSTLRLLHQIQEHHSLLELLKYRLTFSGKSLSDRDKTKLNDLLISELSLATRGSQHSFESEKLHLLFQSFFFINIGDYRSSLKSFKELNSLFGSNESMGRFSPYDYLSALEGILDSLRTISYYDEMPYFIDKIAQLLEQPQQEYFQTTARQVLYIYQLVVLIHQRELQEARQLADTIPAILLKKTSFGSYESLVELLFYVSLTLFLIKDFRHANKHVQVVTTLGGINVDTPIYKASRLLHLLIHYELDNMSYLDYEIRSYKRALRKSGKHLKVETLILKVIKLDLKRKSISKSQCTWKMMEKDIRAIEQDKYEKQVLKYYNFNSWVKEKLSTV